MTAQPEKKNYGIRIKQLREHLNITQEMFGLPVNLNRSNVSKMESGDRSIGPRILKDIIDVYGINLQWWESGEGKMFLDPIYNKINSNVRHIYQLETLKYIDLPVLTVINRQNFVTKNYSTKSLPMYRVMEEAGVSYAEQLIIEMDGDLMEPRYPSGTKVRVEEMEKYEWPTMPAGVYFVAFGNQFTVKRMRNNTINSGYIILESDNKEIGETLTLPLELMHKVWKVCKIVDAPAL